MPESEHGAMPTRDDILMTMSRYGGAGDALTISNAIAARGFTIANAQLALQRATSDGTLVLRSDWTVSLPEGQEPLPVRHALFSGHQENPFHSFEGIHPDRAAALAEAQRLEDAGYFCALVPLEAVDASYLTEGSFE